MDILDYIQRQIVGVRHMVDMTMKDMTPELFKLARTGDSQLTISATFMHFYECGR